MLPARPISLRWWLGVLVASSQPQGVPALRDFNMLLLSLPLGIESAMRLEGGPEASLSIQMRRASTSIFVEVTKRAPLPNVLGVR